MKRILLAAAAIAAASLAYPACATALTFNFNATTYSGGQTSPGTYSDTYTFDTTGDPGIWTISGSLTTHQITDFNNVVQADLDISSVLLDGTAFTPSASNTDSVEDYSLASILLPASPHTLTVNYRVDAADSTNAAIYVGALQIAQVAGATVPEPATWAMFLGGFGLIGAGLRRRRPAMIEAI